MQRHFNILVFLCSLIALIFAKSISLDDDFSEIVSLGAGKQPGDFLDNESLTGSMTFDFDSYTTSIGKLREMVSTIAKNVDKMRIINPKPKDPYTLVSYEGSTVQLVIWNHNLYVLGFVNDYSNRTFWRFSDKEFDKVTIPNTKLQKLKMQSNYGSLTSNANVELKKVDISKYNLPKAITTLSTFTGGSEKELANAMLRLVISTSESTRFTAIERDVAKNLDSGNVYKLGDDGETMVKNWSKYSKTVIELESNPKSTSVLNTTFSVMCNGVSTKTFTRKTLYCLLGVAYKTATGNNDIMDLLFDYTYEIIPDESSSFTQRFS